MGPHLSDDLRRLRTGLRSKRRGQISGQETSAESKRPRMPSTLSPVGQEYWKRIVGLLIKRRTLTKADGPALEILCQQYSRWQLCLKDIEEHGAFIDEVSESGTRRVESPASKAATRLETSQRLMLCQLSCTPLTRERTKRVPIDPRKEEYAEGSAGWYREHAADFERQQPEKKTEPVALDISETDCDFNAEEKEQ